jgi:hypothetical protein
VSPSASDRDLARVVAAATVSNLGSMLTRIALPFVAVDVLHASAQAMSGLSAARVLPSLALGLASRRAVRSGILDFA